MTVPYQSVAEDSAAEAGETTATQNLLRLVTTKFTGFFRKREKGVDVLGQRVDILHS